MMRTFTITARYVRLTDATVFLATYGDHSTALVAEATDEDGFPNRETLSVNLSAYAMTPPEGCVFVRDYSEHEGLVDALVEAGVASLVERITFGPHDVPGAVMKIEALSS